MEQGAPPPSPPSPHLSPHPQPPLQQQPPLPSCLPRNPASTGAWPQYPAATAQAHQQAIPLACQHPPPAPSLRQLRGAALVGVRKPLESSAGPRLKVHTIAASNACVGLQPLNIAAAPTTHPYPPRLSAKWRPRSCAPSGSKRSSYGMKRRPTPSPHPRPQLTRLSPFALARNLCPLLPPPSHTHTLLSRNPNLVLFVLPRM